MLASRKQLADAFCVPKATVAYWLKKRPLAPVVPGRFERYCLTAAQVWWQSRLEEEVAAEVAEEQAREAERLAKEEAREEREHRALDRAIRASLKRIFARWNRERRLAAKQASKPKPLGAFEMKQEALATLVGVSMSRLLGWWDAKLIIAVQDVYGLRTFDVEDLWSQVERGLVRLKPDAAARLEAEIERRRFGLGFSLLPRGDSEMGVYSNELHQTDATRKSAIIALVEAAATEAGATLSAGAGPVTGPLSLDHIRNALGISTSEAARLVEELVVAEDLAVIKDGDSQPNSWRYEPAA